MGLDRVRISLISQQCRLRGVLNPMHHSKKAFKLSNSNRMKFSRQEQRERQPPMQEPKARILDINKSYPSSFTRNIIAKI
jgi:hypothetical protein